MVRLRGYPGSVNQLRRIVKRPRPETGRTVYRRVVTLAGEAAQVDCGSFGKVRIGHGTRAVSGFVMVLGYSRAVAALFTLADSSRRCGSPCPTDRDSETSTSGPMTWRPTMPSDNTTPTTLPTDLQRLGLNRTAEDLDDLIAQATRKRWSPAVLLEHIVAAELEDRQRRSVERRLTRARLGRFKPLADGDWDWPTAFDRPALERILSLDFLERGENVILVGAQPGPRQEDGPLRAQIRAEAEATVDRHRERDPHAQLGRLRRTGRRNRGTRIPRARSGSRRIDVRCSPEAPSSLPDLRS